MSDWLDQHPELLGRCGYPKRGGAGYREKGLTVESVLRCAILKQYRRLSYEELQFCLLDSVSCQAFVRLAMGWGRGRCCASTAP